MACLETDFLIAFFRGNAGAIEKMGEIKNSGERRAITAITAYELFFGEFYGSNQQSISVEKLNAFLQRFELLYFDLLAAQMAGEILAKLKKTGQNIGNMDILTAAIALRHNEAVVTRNVKHFKRIAGLKVEEF